MFVGLNARGYGLNMVNGKTNKTTDKRTKKKFVFWFIPRAKYQKTDLFK